nr:MAG TPA: Protein of unknown function (DUF3970) [Caudoviricetes sp.]
MPVKSANRFEVRYMKITIEATPEELAKLLQAIGSSEEQKTTVSIDEERVGKTIFEATQGNDESIAPRKFSLEEGYGDKIKNPY